MVTLNCDNNQSVFVLISPGTWCGMRGFKSRFIITTVQPLYSTEIDYIIGLAVC